MPEPSTALVAISDLHIGSTVSMCPKVVHLDDGGTYRPGRWQRALLESFEDFIDYSLNLTKGRKRVLAFLGDLCELDSKGRSYQLISRNPADIKRLVYDLLDPLADEFDGLLFIRGTEAHTGKSAHSEEEIAANYDNTIWNGREGQASWWMYEGAIGGIRYFMQHHISMGNLPWTERNAANKYAFLTEYQYLKERISPPDVALSGHVHRYSDSGRNYEVKAFTLPCWTGRTSYIHRIGKGRQPPEIGGMIFYRDENGQLVDVLKTYEGKRTERQVWQASKI